MDTPRRDEDRWGGLGQDRLMAGSLVKALYFGLYKNAQSLLQFPPACRVRAWGRLRPELCQWQLRIDTNVCVG